MFPGLQVAVYPVIGEPLAAPAVKLIVACVFPAVAVPMVGAAGAATDVSVTSLPSPPT
jgi:hypothetical protein